MLRASLVLTLAIFSATLPAEAFDGTYKGTRKTTKIAPYLPGTRLECTPVGKENPLEFVVVGSRITMRYLDFAHQVSGAIGGDGKFSLKGLYPVHGQPDKKVSGTWTGRIEGSRLSGDLHARSPSGECFGVFSARK